MSACNCSGQCRITGMCGGQRVVGQWPVVSAPIAQGWECPKCGRIYSPSMVMCSYCVPAKPLTFTGTGAATNPPYGSFTGVNPDAK